MTLTLPQAGNTPGRAPRTVEQPANTAIGEGLGQLGDALFRLGEEKLDRNKKRAQVDLTRDMNDLRLQVEEIGDPDEADAAWQQGVSGLRTKYLGGEAGASEVLHPNNVPDFELTFDQLANANTFAVGRRNLELRMSERMATFDNYMYEATRAAVNADAETRETLAGTADEHIAGLLQNGVINAEQAESLRQDVRGDLSGAAALQALNDDPAAFLDRMEDGEFSGLAPGTQVRMRNTATDALRKAAETAQKEADKAAKEHVARVVDNLDRISSLDSTERLDPTDRALLDDAGIAELAKGDEDVQLALRKAQARVSLDEDEAVYRLMNPAALQRAIEVERSKKVRHPYQEERLDVLEALLTDKQKALDTNALGHLRDIGLEVPELPLDEGQEAFEAGLAARRRNSDWMRTNGYTTQPVILEPDERKAIKAQLEAEADPAHRRALVEGFTRQLGPDAERVLMQATGDRVVAHAATLIGWGAPGDAVEDILTAQKRIKDGTATRPSEAKFRETFADVTAGRFRDQPELEARIMATAEALYVEANPIGDSTSIDSGEARKAISRALGGDGDLIGGLATINPPGAFNEHELPLPPGVRGDDVNRALHDLYGMVAESRSRDAQGHIEMGGTVIPGDTSRLATISLSGAAPDFGGMDPEAVLSDARIVPIWAGGQPTDRYTFVRTVGGQDIALKDENGGRYEFSLRKLVQGGRP